MFSIHMPRKYTLKCFPSDAAKQLKLCPVTYAVKSSCSSRVNKLLELSEKNEVHFG